MKEGAYGAGGSVAAGSCRRGRGFLAVVTLLIASLGASVGATVRQAVLGGGVVGGVDLPGVWQALGPFPHGSRETGVDPLSAYGGFERLIYDEADRYPSELADNGWVTWRTVHTNSDGTVGPLDFPNVRWEFNRRSYGWSVLHHIIYFRGNFFVPKSGVYLASMSNIVSFKIDHRALVGNVNDYRHASESAVFLDEGMHTLYVALSMDVRRFGGTATPKPWFKGSFRFVDTDNLQHTIIAYPDDTILPDLLDGRRVSNYASVTILNANVHHQSVLSHPEQSSPATQNGDGSGEDGGQFSAPLQPIDGPGWMRILQVEVRNNGFIVPTSLPVLYTVKIAPGQILPIPFQFDSTDKDFPDTIAISVLLQDIDTGMLVYTTVGEFRLNRRVWGDVYKMTFVGFDASIQYAMLRPPFKPCVRPPGIGCPVVISLHGSGVDTDSPLWTEAIRRQDYAWIVFPTGRTSWGFDWHGPSQASVETAIDTLQQLMPGVPADMIASYQASSAHRVYIGHDSGGHGAWWMVMHYPDTAIASIPASGFMKIQHYIPYYMHIGDAYADPVMRGLLEASISENDLDLYASNAEGIPIFARTGGDDETVPPIHTRRLVRIMNEWSRNPAMTTVSEIPGRGHWFEGVVNDDTIQEFLDTHLSLSKNPTLSLPPLPEAFTIQTLNPASSGSKGGIRILQLEIPFRLGMIRVHRYGNTWVLNTTNLRRFGFAHDQRQAGIESWSIDGTDFPTPPLNSGPSYLKIDGVWQLASDLLWISRERHPSTYGPASLVFSHAFRIVLPTSPNANRTLYRQIAQHIASSWYLSSLGGTQIVRDVDVLDGVAAQYNLIVLGGPDDNFYTRRREKEGDARLVEFVTTPRTGFRIANRTYTSPGTGILFLAPSPTRTRLGLFIAGVDDSGIRRAAWTIPFRTGLQVPDYLVVGDEFGDPATGWTAGDGSPFGGGGTKGVGGIFAAGFWSNTWEYDDRCGYLK